MLIEVHDLPILAVRKKNHSNFFLRFANGGRHGFTTLVTLPNLDLGTCDSI